MQYNILSTLAVFYSIQKRVEKSRSNSYSKTTSPRNGPSSVNSLWIRATRNKCIIRLKNENRTIFFRRSSYTRNRSSSSIKCSHLMSNVAIVKLPGIFPDVFLSVSCSNFSVHRVISTSCGWISDLFRNLFLGTIRCKVLRTIFWSRLTNVLTFEWERLPSWSRRVSCMT